MKSKIFSAIIILLVGITGGIFFEKYSDVLKGWFPGSFITGDNDSSGNQKDPMADWAIISNGLGYSLKYPYKDMDVVFDPDRYSRVSFDYFPEAFTKDKQLAEKLRADISETGLSYEFDISVSNDATLMFGADFQEWIKTFLANDPVILKNKEKVLSEETSPVVFSGKPAYLVVRKIEMPQEKRGLRYTRKDVFTYDEVQVYRVSRVAASDDTVFLRSGAAGKEFLDYIDTRSSEILQTFVFDKSIRDSKISLPKVSVPKLTGKSAENREKLLVALRQGPFFDEKQAYQAIPPQEQCPYKSMSFSLDDFIAGDKNVAELNIFDKDGNYHGVLPVTKENGFFPMGDSVPGITWNSHSQFVDSRSLSFAKESNQKIGVIGKKFSTAKLSIRNVGNTCQIFEAIIPVTPYSIASLTTNQGNISPISYDVDGDGVEDLQLSPIHPLFPEKKAQFDAVLADMKAVEKK
jgi:hypothetical protein